MRCLTWTHLHHPKIWNSPFYHLLGCLKYCCKNGKQCRTWSDAAYCSVWSGSTLFAKAYLSQYLGLFTRSSYARQNINPDCWYKFTYWITVQIQISWLLIKRGDLDLHCLQWWGISRLSRTMVKIQVLRLRVCLLKKCKNLYKYICTITV